MKYIFIHIGKTAGTSFRNFLTSNVKKHYFGYAKTHYLTHANPKFRVESKFYEVEPRGNEIFNMYDLFSEHAPFGLHTWLPTKDYQYITVLREPISRILSAYRYAIDRKWITSDVNVIDWYHSDTNNDISFYQINHVSGLPMDLPPETKLNKALLNLEDDKFLFGFTEAYNEFIDLCCETNKWEPQYRVSNQTRTKKEVSPQEKTS